MTYEVIIQPPAKQDIEAAYLYLRQNAPAISEKWLAGLERAIRSLERLPTRCGVARESPAFSEVIRQLLYGKRKGVYRVLFVVRGRTVRVLHVRHASRDAMNPDELKL